MQIHTYCLITKDQYASTFVFCSQMRHIVYTVGYPPDLLLNAGLYTQQFFKAKYSKVEPHTWRFKVRLFGRHLAVFIAVQIYVSFPSAIHCIWSK